MDFQSVEALYSYVQNQILIGAESVGEHIKELLKDYVDTMWYSVHTPEEYHRTMQFINSISVKTPILIGNTIQVEVYFDEGKIAPSMDNRGFWNQHMGVNGEDVSGNIPRYIEEGNNSSLYSYNGIHMTKETEDFCRVNNVPVKLMVDYLKANGIECTG